MTCRDIESLILAERDGALTNEQRSALSVHVAACPACQLFKADLTAALDSFSTASREVRVPDVDAAWNDLRAEIGDTAIKTRQKKRPFAPVIWFGAPLAAAAAIAVAFIGINTPDTAAPSPLATMPEIAADTARADFVEAGDANASTMVYVDKESGWLVVWATDVSTTPSRG